MFANTPAGVPAAPPVSGLVAAAARPDTTSPDWAKWELGVVWVQERAGIGWQLTPWCADPDPGSYDPPRPGAAYYRPVGVRFADECSTLDGPADDARIQRIAEASTPFAVARELWTGAGSLDEPYTIPGLSGEHTNMRLASPDADVITQPSGASPLLALGRLEQAALEESRGQQIALHVPVAALPLLHDAFRAVGGLLVTHAGNLLIADGGYPGTDPDGAADATGATTWAYATTPPVVLMSPLDPIRDDPSRVDRTTNTRTTWTSRVIAAVVEPGVHLATELSLT